jgi:plastocyanin
VRLVAAAAALATAGALWAAPALGDATISAGPVPDTYANTDVTIDQGQTLTFQNGDQTAFHDVTADQKDSDGKPLFASDTIEGGKSSPVRGVEFLTTGDYTFHCSVHNFMTGTVHVTANGTPKPRTPDNPAPNPTDKNPPDATVAIGDSRISGVLKHGGVSVRLTTNEPARFKLVATSGKTTVATRTLVVKGTKLSGLMPLTKKGKQLLSKAKSVRLKLAAKVNDAADNRSSATATRTLR